MTTLTFPTLSRLPSSFDFGLVSNTMTFVSPLSQAVQTIEMPSARWRFSFTMQNLEEADAALLQAFLVQLRGQAGRFYMYNMARTSPRGVGTGTPKVNGASQTGVTLVTDGWTISQTGILKAGDLFSVNGELKMVVADCNSDSGGNATITFEPPLRASPSDNADLTTASPTTTFKLTSDDNGWSTQSPVWTTFNLQGVEVI